MTHGGRGLVRCTTWHGRVLMWRGAPSSRVRWTGYLTLKGYLIWSARSRSNGAGMMEAAGHRGRHVGWRRHGRRRANLGGGHWYGVLDLSGANRTYWDDLQASTNTLGALPRREGCQSVGSTAVPWPVAQELTNTMF